jgi:hypothetical protein
MLARSATTLLVASTLLGIEAAVLLILGSAPARDLVVRPFILLAYLEVCAMFFSAIFIVAGIVGLIFYRPYLFICEKMFLRRARRAGELGEQYTFYDNIPSPIRTQNPEEDGAPD